MKIPGDPQVKANYIRITADLKEAASNAMAAFGKDLWETEMVTIKLPDDESASSLGARIAKFAELRLNLGLFNQIDVNLRTGRMLVQDESGELQREFYTPTSEKTQVKDRTITVALKHLLPPELLDTARDVASALHPTFSVSDRAPLFTEFHEAYRDAAIVNIYYLGYTEEQKQSDARAVYTAHMALRRFAECALLEFSEKRPSMLTLFSDRGAIHVRIDGAVVDIAKTPLRALLVASQLGYDRFFSVEEFCMRVFGASSPTLAKDFDRSLRLVSEISTLDWEFDEAQNRRLLDVILKCECSDAETDRFLRETDPRK